MEQYSVLFISPRSFEQGRFLYSRAPFPLGTATSLKSPQHTDPIPGCMHRCNPAVAFLASRIELVVRAQSPALGAPSVVGAPDPEFFP